MRRGALSLVALALLATGKCFADSPAPLIPLPAEIAPGQGTFAVGPGTAVRVPAGDADAAEAARYLAEKVARTRGLKLTVGADVRAGADTRTTAGALSGASAQPRAADSTAAVNTPTITFQR